MTGKQLKQIRKRLRWTQAQVAKAVGVSTNTVARWERGEVPISEPAARLLQSARENRKGGHHMQTSTAETIAEMLEQEFPTATGRKIASLTRTNERLSLQIDEIEKQIAGEGWRDSESVRKKLREFVKLVKQSVKISDQIKAELNKLWAESGLQNLRQ